MNSKVRTCLWFEKDGQKAAAFYVSLLPDSHLEDGLMSKPGEPRLVVDFILGGTPFQIINGGPEFKQTEAVSISVLTRDQAETDRLWDALCSDGGSPSQCGWLKDRFGVSWQIVPELLPRLARSENREAADRAFQAVMGMTKINIAELQAAFDGQMG